MAEAPDSLEPVGTGQARAAHYAWVAAAFHGSRWNRFEEWASRSLPQALRLRDVQARTKGSWPPTNRGRPRKDGSTRPPHVMPPALIRPETDPLRADEVGELAPRLRRIVMQDWHLVDEKRLGLCKTLFTIRGVPPDERVALHRTLNRMAGVRQWIELNTDYRLLVISITRTREEAEDLRARLQDRVRERIEAETVELESHAPAPQTWLDLAAKEIAKIEQDG